MDGSRVGGFEELCAQLARAESLPGAKFERTGSPDAGVECYSVLSDGSECGWQAKYFSKLGDSQWRQLDKSVKTALDKHPALVRYFVCVPMDRSDGRICGRRSAMDRWNERVVKWQQWARGRGMYVEFIWWGASELIDRLSRPQHIGTLNFWFGTRAFDHSWFRKHINDAIRVVADRYSPDIHIELAIAQQLATFARTDESFNRIKSLARGLRRAFGAIRIQRSQDNSLPQDAKLNELHQIEKAILKGFADLESTPVDPMPLDAIAENVDTAASIAAAILEVVRQHERDYDDQQSAEEGRQSYRANPFTEWANILYRLRAELSEASACISEADRIVNSRLMVLKGVAGTGKTHLLCDLASRRVAVGAPVILLLGHRFTEPSEPWTQVLQMLGMHQGSPEHFIGALEAAAQASHSRALVIIDAVNDGRGSEVWPAHLEPLLAQLEQSPWIAVVCSVRSSYDESVVPEDVRDRAVVITHYGFDGSEYDALQKFFLYYGLELPSAPILQPEFRNPLFLKIICKGLSLKCERRLPRGFHGIVAAFSLYVEAVNGRLADRLDYNWKDNFVRLALDAFSKELVETESSWVVRPRAQQLVNELLPIPSFRDSLYRGLVSEGVLYEDKAWWTDNPAEEVVFIAFDRFADHIIVDSLLRNHVDVNNPEVAFTEDGYFGFLHGTGGNARYGLIEALCIQVPEHTGRELVRLAPKVLDTPSIGEAFLASIIWRKLDAFSEDTMVVWKELRESGKIRGDQLEVLLTISTIPSHPFNAEFLDQRLRQETMPERDSWWSTYLHRAWGSEGAVDRLVEWASNLRDDEEVDTSVVNLAATTLAWMLTTPNRFLRDRATKALVSLLTGRYKSTMQLIDRFSDVDDIYVAERVYAVACGVAMRSHDAQQVGRLASLVYNKVFAAGTPPVHILLRDYARGVVERAIYLDRDIELDEQAIRPPYNSVWPPIPSEKCIEALTPNPHGGAWEGGDPEWSRNRIRWSVMEDDFARYVIGTNSRSGSNWLSLRREEGTWLSLAERKQMLRSDLSEREQIAWQGYERAEAAMPLIIEFTGDERWTFDRQGGRSASVDKQALEQAQRHLENSLHHLMAELTEEHRAELASILRNEGSQGGSEEPRFDLQVVQRYVLWRVFDLGWTVERFGGFDRMVNWHSGREAAKSERMGKKYQWIAYHEILAFIADHYQYRERFGGDDGGRHYRGPWQEYLHLRDIDPSNTLRSAPDRTSRHRRDLSWWGKQSYEDWNEGTSHRDWLASREDIPEIGKLLKAFDPDEGDHWINLRGEFSWQQPHPPDTEPFDSHRRELWLRLTGYFVRAENVDGFKEWVKTIGLGECWMPVGETQLYLGEHGWSPAFTDLCADLYREGGWVVLDGETDSNCRALARPCSFAYLSESGGFDCSVDEGYTLQLPHHQFSGHLGLKWSGWGADYLDEHGRLAACDPTAHEDGPSALLVREDLLRQYLKEEGVALCWVVAGEKQVLGGVANGRYYGRLELSGIHQYDEREPHGCLDYRLRVPDGDTNPSTLE